MSWCCRSSWRTGVGWYLCGILLLSHALAAAAGVLGNDLRGYELRTWQADDGLPQNSVTALAQTPDGYLWVGTREGLARFDGVQFKVVDEPAAPYLKTAYITGLYACRDGTLWIACENNGLTRLRDRKFTHFLQRDGLPDNQIQCMLETRDGTVWFGGETGLVRYRGNQFAALTDNEMLYNNSVKALCEDRDGIVRVATVTGLVSVDATGKASRDNFGLGPVPGVFKAVCVDRQRRLWLGATDGLISIQDGKRNSYAANKSLLERITTVLYEDRVGQLWIGTYEGLSRRINGTLVPWRVDRNTFSDLVNVVLEDSENNIWVGGRDGLYRLSPARFVNLTMQDGLSGKNIVSVLQDRTGTMWFGAWGGGLNRYADGQVDSITTTHGLSHDMVLSLSEGRHGGLWIGMQQLRPGLDPAEVVNHLRPGGTNILTRLRSITNTVVRVLHERDDGTLWVGTARGLHRVQGDEMTLFTTNNGLAGNDVTAVLTDHETNLWFGTDGGLSRWTGEEFLNLTPSNGLSHGYVNALYQDAGEDIWIGTRGGGLNRLRAGVLTSYTTAQGLFNDEIYEILEDDLGYLWMTCRRGIFRVNRQQFDALDQGRIQRVNCTVFGREDGLATVQFNGVAKPAGWKSRDGRLWFASIGGLLVVEPRIRINDRIPTLAIEEVSVDQKILWRRKVSESEPTMLTIPPGNGRVEIRYTALSLQAAEKNRFKYRLEDVDQEWVDVGNQRVAYYNNVLPGRYRFQVIASNNDGIWNDEPVSMWLRIEPHFWQTWWFRGFLILLPVLIAIWIYRARVARLRELENLRIRIAADLHDDVGSRLTKVAMVTELADRETARSEAAKPHIQNISRTVRDITRAMDEIVWTINPRNDTLDNLANYIFHYAQEYFQDTGVRCRLDLPAVLPEQRLPTEVRHNLFMAVKEALNNILKHAGATEVRIGLTFVDEVLTLIITDNGHGLTGGGDPTGAGITNMRQRLDKIGGQFDWRSEPGNTTITLRLPGKRR